jgi:hypothetical protein
MDFATLILFVALYYLRPQEWVKDFNRVHPIQLLSVLAILALALKGKLKFKNLVQTPLDWLMLFYFLWTLIAGFQPRQSFGYIQSNVLLYFVGVCSLDSIPRMKKFLGWWCGFVFIIALLALASQYGFDPLYSYSLTQGPMKGRLVLNLSIFNNPNALAHSIIPAVPLFYYLVYWRGAIMKASIILLGIPVYCIFLTQSKGAFLSGFATLLATLTFGRSRPAQILILILAIGFGYGALYQLPRMSELNRAQTDPAIQGRVAAFNFGLSMMRQNFFGIGLGNFQKEFYENGPTEKYRVVREVHINHLGDRRRFVYVPRHYTKASHSAYNENGAELGYVGLFLFVGILYCCIRTLLLVKSRDGDEECIRRALFAVVVSYAASCWMVDFCYRPTFFMMVAAISAFHRYLLRQQASASEPVELAPVPKFPWLRRLPPIAMPGIPLPGLAAPVSAPLPALPAGLRAQDMAPSPGRPSPFQPQLLPVPHFTGGMARWGRRGSLEEVLSKKFIWTRLGIIDFVIMVALTYAAILYWKHLIVTM